MRQEYLIIQKGLKRGFDILISLFVLIFFFPVGLLVALIIKLDSPGPIFFRQARPGYNLRFFPVYKFRTMWHNAAPTPRGQEVTLDDTRITPVGRFLRRYKIDELPQFWNVFKGEMSLVGPRPENSHNLAGYSATERKRFRMKPGLTGLAQINGNIYLSLAERHQYDLTYIENFSLKLDGQILLRTVGVLFWGEEKFVRGKTEQ